MKNVVITSTCLLLAIVFAACVSQTTVPELEESSQEITPTNSDEESTPTTENGVMIEPATPTNTFTLAEVEKHAAPEDCWLAIEGKVYDVTDFIASGNHPGGEAIVMGCGTDATEIFNDRPNGSGAHSDAARAYLPQFYIGDLEG